MRFQTSIFFQLRSGDCRTIPMRFRPLCILQSSNSTIPHSVFYNLRSALRALWIWVREVLLSQCSLWIWFFYVPISSLCTLAFTAVNDWPTFGQTWPFRIYLQSKEFRFGQHHSWWIWIRREFNFSHHHPVHFQFWFDQRVPRPIRPWSVYVIKVPILDIHCIVNFYSVLGCVYIQVYTWLWVHRLCQ